MRICLFEQRSETLEPLSLTRPVFDLICGITTLGDKQPGWAFNLEADVLAKTIVSYLERQGK